MFFVRWLPTFLGFPIGGLLAVQAVGSVDGPGTAALAGLLAGVVIGAAQWLALRSRGIGLLWLLITAVAMSAGGAVAAAINDSGTSVSALVVGGLVQGAVVGGAQGFVLGRGPVVLAAWTATVAAAWMLGWWVTANVIVDADRGYAAFGSSGAVVATVLTGLVLSRLLGAVEPLTTPPPSAEGTAPAEAASR